MVANDQELHLVQDELVKQLKMRQSKRAQAQDRADEIAGQIKSHSEPEVLRCNLELERFMSENYHPEIDRINAHFNPQIEALSAQIQPSQDAINEKVQELSAIASREITRREALVTARTALENYQAVLAKHKGMYVPMAAIPKVDLLRFLDTTDENVLQDIHQIYQTAEEAGKYYGFNTNNLYNALSHYTSFLGASPLQYEMANLPDYIQQRLLVINRELDNAPVDSELGILQAQQREVAAAKAELDGQKDLLDRQQAQLEDEKAQQLEQLNQLKSDKEHHQTVAAFEHQKNACEHALARLNLDVNVLEFRIEDILAAQQRLLEICHELDTKSVDEALSYLQNMQAQIEELNVERLLSVIGFGESITAHDLWNSSQEQLTTIETQVTDLLARRAELTPLEATLMEGAEKVSKDLNEQKAKRVLLEELVQRATNLNHDYNTLIQNKKDLLLALQQLNNMQVLFRNLYPQILNNHLFQVDDVQERESLLKEIESFRTQYLLVLHQNQSNPNVQVQEHYAALMEMDKKLYRAYSKLRLERIADHSAALLNRFPAKSEIQRVQLLNEVERFERKELDFMNRLPEDLPMDLHEVKSRILQIHHKKAALETPLTQVKPPPTFQMKIASLSSQFYGNKAKSGIFAEYLKERSKKFWFGDLFCSFAALSFKHIGYKSPHQERKRYIYDKLKPALDAYAASDSSDREAFHKLMKLLCHGQKKFHPRAKKGHKGYHKSLSSKLELLKQDLFKIESARRAQKAEVDDMDRAFAYFR